MPKYIRENMNTVINEEFTSNCGFLTTKNINSRSKWRELRKLLDNNTVVKVKRGLYRLDGLNCDQRVEVAKIIPDGVFCMFTAWQHYNLTTYNPFEFYVAVRKKQKVSLPAYPPVKLHYWIDKFYLLGTAEIMIDNQPIKIYDLEKSVCDAVRFRNKVGMDMLSEILQNYIKRTDKDLNRLSQYSRELKIENIMNDFIILML